MKSGKTAMSNKPESMDQDEYYEFSTKEQIRKHLEVLSTGEIPVEAEEICWNIRLLVATPNGQASHVAFTSDGVLIPPDIEGYGEEISPSASKFIAELFMTAYRMYPAIRELVEDEIYLISGMSLDDYEGSLGEIRKSRRSSASGEAN